MYLLLIILFSINNMIAISGKELIIVLIKMFLNIVFLSNNIIIRINMHKKIQLLTMKLLVLIKEQFFTMKDSNYLDSNVKDSKNLVSKLFQLPINLKSNNRLALQNMNNISCNKVNLIKTIKHHNLILRHSHALLLQM